MSSASVQFPENFAAVNLVGSGGMGSVYSADDRSMNRKVAIKVISTGDLSASQLKRFRSEAKALSQLDHPNIIKVHSFGLLNNAQPYMVLEFVAGESLDKVLERDGKLEIARALPIFRQIAEALSHAHSKGIIHRDIKPSNVMIVHNDGGVDLIKLLDFGVARNALTNTHVTGTGTMIGTPAYASPEQCMGKHIDFRSDIYSLGCLMYEVVSGHPPFHSDNAMELIMQQCSAEPERITDLPEGIDRILRKCLMKDPSHRFQNCEELIAALDAGDTTLAALPRKRLAPSPKLNPYFVASICILLASATVVFLWQRDAVNRYESPVTAGVADTFMKKEKWPEAEKAFSWLIKNDRLGDHLQLSTYYYRRGHARLRQKRPNEAENDFRTAYKWMTEPVTKERDPVMYQKTAQSLGEALLEQDRFIEAEPYFSAAKKTAPEGQLPLIDFGLARAQQASAEANPRLFADAEKSFVQTLHDYQSYRTDNRYGLGDTYGHLAYCQEKLGKPKEALTNYIAAEKIQRELHNMKLANELQAKITELKAGRQ
jgi:serine/threonine protein kinase